LIDGSPLQTHEHAVIFFCGNCVVLKTPVRYLKFNLSDIFDLKRRAFKCLVLMSPVLMSDPYSKPEHPPPSLENTCQVEGAEKKCKMLGVVCHSHCTSISVCMAEDTIKYSNFYAFLKYSKFYKFSIYLISDCGLPVSRGARCFWSAVNCKHDGSSEGPFEVNFCRKCL